MAAVRTAPELSLEQPFGRYRPRTPKQKVRQLEKLGVMTPLDLLLHLPRDYEDRSQITGIGDARTGRMQTFRGVISAVEDQGKARQTATLYAVRGGRRIPNLRLSLTWFRQPHLCAAIRDGDIVQVTGMVEEFRGRRGITQPEYDIVEDQAGCYELVNTGLVVPIYRLTAGMTQDYLRWPRPGLRR